MNLDILTDMCQSYLGFSLFVVSSSLDISVSSDSASEVFLHFSSQKRQLLLEPCHLKHVAIQCRISLFRFLDCYFNVLLFFFKSCRNSQAVLRKPLMNCLDRVNSFNAMENCRRNDFLLDLQVLIEINISMCGKVKSITVSSSFEQIHQRLSPLHHLSKTFMKAVELFFSVMSLVIHNQTLIGPNKEMIVYCRPYRL